MGLNDAAEMLEAAQAQSIRDERQIEHLTQALGDAEHALARAEDLVDALRHAPDGAGIVLTADEARLAWRACRHSAESIAAVLEVDPSRLHPDVAPYVDLLTELADRLREVIA